MKLKLPFSNTSETSIHWADPMSFQASMLLKFTRVALCELCPCMQRKLWLEFCRAYLELPKGVSKFFQYCLFLGLFSILFGNHPLGWKSWWSGWQYSKLAQDPSYSSRRLRSNRQPILETIRLESNLFNSRPCGNWIIGSELWNHASVRDEEEMWTKRSNQ